MDPRGFVQIKNLMRPSNSVHRAYAGWMRLRPKLQIVNVVVVLYTVDVVDCFVWQEVPSEMGLHDQNVVEHLW